MIDFHFNKEDGIIYAKSTGEITLEQMIDAREKVLAAEDIPHDLRILEDATEAVISFSMAELRKLREFAGNQPPKYNFVGHAVIMNSPKGVAFGMWFNEHSRRMNYKVKIFQTREAALKWLNVAN
ncbi:MAG: STAS/SEC14 domain-containing protein [Bacteroidetes bacterium]|nr:STAS/SEC14 domain-containing protein [Bacteroidota bacterium]